MGLISFRVRQATSPRFRLEANSNPKRWRRARIDSPVEYLETRYGPVIRQMFTWQNLPVRIIDDALKLVEIARARGDRVTIDRAIEAIRTHLEIGWDSSYGGLYLAVDADGGRIPAWPFHDSKLWWPQVESMVGTLMAYEQTRDPEWLEWHERLRAYSFDHYPVPEHGEWRQKLDRRGEPITEVVALPVKDPFHLPRALITCIEILERLLAD